MTWAAVYVDDDVHVVPVDGDCWCMAKRDEEEPAVVVHNALDQRERYETGELKLQ